MMAVVGVVMVDVMTEEVGMMVGVAVMGEVGVVVGGAMMVGVAVMEEVGVVLAVGGAVMVGVAMREEVGVVQVVGGATVMEAVDVVGGAMIEEVVGVATAEATTTSSSRVPKVTS